MRNLTAHAAVAVLFLASCTGSNPKPADSTATKDTAVAGTNRAADTAGTIVDIQDARQTSPPANNPADHKDRDVVVFRMTHQRNGQSFPAY